MSNTADLMENPTTKISADTASIILEYANYFEYADILDDCFPGCKEICYNKNIEKRRYL
jgi:hypothetical protein